MILDMKEMHVKVTRRTQIHFFQNWETYTMCKAQHNYEVILTFLVKKNWNHSFFAFADDIEKN